MGQNFSHLDREVKQWENHKLEFDDETRERSISTLETIPDGVAIYVGAIDKEFGGLKFKHWFVTDLKYIIEFGSRDGNDLYSEKLLISKNSLRKYYVDQTTLIPVGEFDTEKRCRVFYLLGMKNYSICLRNSEHVANYVVHGHWTSAQMGRNEPLGKFFEKPLGNAKNKLNCFPSMVLPCNLSTNNKPIYTFTDNIYKATEYSYYMDSKTNETKNILLFGTTGSGKSHLVNIMFNNQICESNQSHTSVTTEICFITGKEIQPKRESKPVIVADTIGLCDTEWDEKLILEFIKGRTSCNVSHIDVVLIVFKADRLIPSHVNNIKEILKWLNYETYHKRFIFVATNADHMTPDDVEVQRKLAAEKFGIQTTQGVDTNKIIYVAFPPEKSLNAIMKAKCQKSWENLKKAIQGAEIGRRIPVPSMKSKFCNIL